MGTGTFVISLAVVLTSLTACNRGPTRPTPPNVPPAEPQIDQQPARRFRTHVAGTVFQVTHDTVQPLAGAKVVPETGYDTGDRSVLSDSTGRYQITGLRERRGYAAPLQSLLALKERYSQPCRPTIDDWLSPAGGDVNIYLVANDILATKGMPPLLPLSGPSLSGTVFERGASRGNPVAGAIVDADFFLVAVNPRVFPNLRGPSTFTDAGGRYTLCGLAQPYSVFWDWDGTPYPAGSAMVRASRPETGAPVTNVLVDVRTVTQLDIDVD